jgi:tetratricopeptide (TPR) repeat protein
MNLSLRTCLSATALLLLSATGVNAQLSIELPNGQSVQVQSIDARPDGTLAIIRDGQPMNLNREQYVRAIGARPPQLDEAFILIGQGNAKEAQAKLSGIIGSRSAMFQTWDVVAGVTLANLQIEANDGPGARRTLDTLMQRYGDRATTIFPQLIPLQWRTRIAQGQIAGLEEELNKIILEDKDRLRQAQAQIVRGDLKRKRSDLKAALLDYLRTAHFFSQDDAASAEALFKVGSTFQELGENANARRYFNELKERFPKSEFAARIPAGG